MKYFKHHDRGTFLHDDYRVLTLVCSSYNVLYVRACRLAVTRMYLYDIIIISGDKKIKTTIPTSRLVRHKFTTVGRSVGRTGLNEQQISYDCCRRMTVFAFIAPDRLRQQRFGTRLQRSAGIILVFAKALSSTTTPSPHTEYNIDRPEIYVVVTAYSRCNACNLRRISSK